MDFWSFASSGGLSKPILEWYRGWGIVPGIIILGFLTIWFKIQYINENADVFTDVFEEGRNNLKIYTNQRKQLSRMFILFALLFCIAIAIRLYPRLLVLLLPANNTINTFQNLTSTGRGILFNFLTVLASLITVSVGLTFKAVVIHHQQVEKANTKKGASPVGILDTPSSEVVTHHQQVKKANTKKGASPEGILKDLSSSEKHPFLKFELFPRSSNEKIVNVPYHQGQWIIDNALLQSHLAITLSNQSLKLVIQRQELDFYTIRSNQPEYRIKLSRDDGPEQVLNETELPLKIGDQLMFPDEVLYDDNRIPFALRFNGEEDNGRPAQSDKT